MRSNSTKSSSFFHIFVGVLLAMAIGVSGCSRKKDKALISGIDATVDATNSSIVASGGPVVADGAATASIQITLLDSSANPVAGVTPAFEANPSTGIGASGASCSVSDANGISNCVLSSTVAETKTVSISYPITKAGNSVDFEAGAAAKLCFSTQPGGGTAGVSWSQQPVVFVGDANCNLKSTATNTITMALSSGTAETLGGSLSRSAVAGVASFTNLKLNLVGTDKKITASSAGLTSVESSAFSILGSSPISIAFVTQPGGGSAAVAWAQQPVVRLVDTYGNTATGSSATVTLGILSGTGTLSGATSKLASSGVATFAGLNINAVGSKTLRAVSLVGSGTLTVDSNAFTITAGLPAKLAFSTEPVGGTLGMAFPQQPVVQVQDAGGNLVSTANNSITLDILTGSGTLSGTNPVSASGGNATFSGLSINAAGNKVLRAQAAGLASATSGTFSILATAPTKLCLVNSPGDSGPEVAGVTFASQPVVSVCDSLDNVSNTATGTVSISVLSGGTLFGTTSVAVSSGYALFPGLSMTQAGAGKNLRATYSGPLGSITAINFNLFTVNPGNPTTLQFSVQPSNGSAGFSLATQPVVRVLDFYSNVVSSSTDPITLSLGSTSTGVLTGGGLVSASNGTASFSTVSVDTTGTKTLVATSGTLNSVTSNSFVISSGPASKLSFVNTGTMGGVSMAVWANQPKVVVQDALGNTVNSPVTVNLSLVGTGTLGGSTSAVASSGTASFSGLSANLAETGKYLTASSAGLTGGTSAVFDILTGGFSKLCVKTQPSNGTAGVAFAAAPEFYIADQGCNTLLGATNNVSLSVISGTGTLSGVTNVNASAGLASFNANNLSFQASGPKVLRATSGTVTVDTASFVISPDAVSKLAFTTQPGNGTATVALLQQPVLQFQDQYNNPVSSESSNVSLAVSSGTLSGTSTVAAVSGVASFSGLSINPAGTKTLLATSPALGTLSFSSNSFVVSVGAAAKLVYLTQPGGGTAGLAWSQQPVIQVQDFGGNPVTAGSVSIALNLTAGAGSVLGTTNRFTSNGTAAFSGLNMTVAGTDKVITATSAGLTSAVSTPAFTISPAAPSAAVSTFAASPSTVFAGGSTFISTLSGVLMDAYSNPIPSKTVNVSSSRGVLDSFMGSTAVSNALGQVSYSVYSSTAGLGTMAINVPVDGVTVTQKPVVTFESYDMNVAQSSWSLAPVTLAADGASTAALNVVLRNINGNVLPSKSFSVVSSRGVTDTIASSPTSTDGSGAATVLISSSTRGEPVFTITSTSTLTNAAKLLFYDVAPIADWQAQLAKSDVNSMGPGSNSPATTTWKDLFNLGPNDGTLNNVGTIATSGWCGNGTGTVGLCTTGAYRLVLDGTNDFVNFGTGVNSSASRTHEVWTRTATPTDRGEMILSNGDGGTKGIAIRTAWDGSGKIELTAGKGKSYPGEVWADSPVGYYRFDSGAGVTIATANVGTNLTYTTIGTTGTASGLQDNGSSAFFNGTNSSASAGNIYPPNANMTISAVIYATSISGTDTIVAKGSTATGYALELNAGRVRMRSRNGANVAQTVTGATTLSVNTWYHVAGVRDASGLTMRVYVNGVQDGSVAVTNTVIGNTNNFTVGRNVQNANFFAGRIDEVAIFNSALSPARIAAQANARNLHTCYSTSPMLANTWRHLAATFDGTSKDMSLYVNGVLHCTRASTGYNVDSSTYPLAIGAEVDGGNTATAPYYGGMFGDIRVYDQVLSAGQLLNNYNATSSRFP